MKYAVMLLRYIKGYALFKAEGGFTERFLNLCSKRGIVLWNLRSENNILYAYISVASFRKIRDAARKSGVKITLIKKRGLLYSYRHYSKRIGVVFGLLFFLVFHLIMNQFVWCIDVKGNNNISSHEIISKAEKAGLTQGTFKHNFDEIKASRIIAGSYDGKVPWMSINIKGSLAVIELREDNKTISELESNNPCNIIADFDGIILSAETYRGECMTRAGYGVKKGDMLISGAIDNEDFSTTFYRAKGKLTALHEKNINLKYNIQTPLYKLTETDKKVYVSAFAIEFPFTNLKMSHEETLLNDKEYLNINGYNLPFYIRTEKSLSTQKISPKKNEGVIIYLEETMSNIYTDFGNTTVISQKEAINLSDNLLSFIGKYTVIDFIGEEKPILSEK